MTLDEIKNNYLESYLISHGIDTSRNFKCIDPAHDDKNPSCNLFRNDKGEQRFYCRSCKCKGSLVDAIMLIEGKTQKEAIEEMRRLYDTDYQPRYNYQPKIKESQEKSNQVQQDLRLDLTQETQQTHNALYSTNDIKAKQTLEYLHSRGLTDETIRHFKLGYSAGSLTDFLRSDSRVFAGKDRQRNYTLILPFFDEDQRCVYVQAETNNRELTDETNEKLPKYNKPALNKKYSNEFKLTQPYFNEYYLTSSAPLDHVFLVEGVYDAISLEQLSNYKAKAIALCGTAHNRLINLVKANKDKLLNTCFILALDNDKTGTDETQKISDKLLSLGYNVTKQEPFTQTQTISKDYNEFLLNQDLRLDEKQIFIERQLQTAHEAKNKKEKEIKQEFELNYQLAKSMSDIASELITPKKFVSTGFYNLDRKLGGGLFTGLYTLGAISGLGKTTFCLQIADQLAQAGQFVLFFSLEMSRFDLVARSCSRYSKLHERDYKFKPYSVSEFTQNKVYKSDMSCFDDISDEQLDERRDHLYKHCRNCGEHLFIVENKLTTSITEIIDTSRKFKELYSVSPIIFIDYLQVVQRPEEHLTDKQMIDKNIIDLSKLSRELDTSIIAVSSFNRENYDKSTSFVSFKESGNIEYLSDVVLALDYDPEQFSSKETAKEELNNKRVNAEPITVRVNVLKNRKAPPQHHKLGIIHRYNLFID